MLTVLRRGTSGPRVVGGGFGEKIHKNSNSPSRRGNLDLDHAYGGGVHAVAL